MPELQSSATGWTVQPPPPPARRNAVPAILAGVLALLILVGAVTTFALRAVPGAGSGAGSPEAAAEGLLAAVADRDPGRIAELVVPAEARVAEVNGTRVLDLVTSALGQSGGGKLTADGVRFRTVGPTGDAALVELAEGRIGVPMGGGSLSLPVSEINKRLGEATGGKLDAVRLVAVAEGGRWRIGLLASAAFSWLTSMGARPADVSTLVSGTVGEGAATPEAAVEHVVAAVTSGDVETALSLLVPDEARVLGGVRPLVADLAARNAGVPSDPTLKWLLGAPGGQAPAITVTGLTLATTQIADGVVRVTPTGGTITGPDGKPEKLGASDDDMEVIAVEQDGLWYPSLLFTQIDKALTGAP